jgi:hypothetical protein
VTGVQTCALPIWLLKRLLSMNTKRFILISKVDRERDDDSRHGQKIPCTINLIVF